MTNATVDLTQLETLRDEGYLTARPHPSADLCIWNYTPKCQFERYWTPETLMCRGLITTSAGKVVARPFQKFFNLDEHLGDLPLEPFTVTAKEDGSLGILYWMPDGEPRIATRGSFESEQALRATTILHQRYSQLIPLLRQDPSSPAFTYLFEIIYPQNRIVVDYGSREDLVLLAIIHTTTGMEMDLRGLTSDWPTPIVRRYDGISNLAQLRAIQEENAEGFVIRFASGLRLKLKFAEYLRLHRLLTQVNTRVIWDLLRHDQSLDDLLARVPDEFYAWVKATREALLNAYGSIETTALRPLPEVRQLATRKEQAAVITRSAYPGITFAMLDNKPYAEAIWKLVRPEALRPFREENEA